MKDTFARVSTRVHRTVYTASNGRIGASFFGLPVVEVTMKGARTGKLRHVMLGAPVLEADRIVLVASYDGAPEDPVWYRNLSADPHVTVRHGRESKAMVARTASAEEKAQLWPRIVEASRSYAKAQARTDRDIPVVILAPAAGRA